MCLSTIEGRGEPISSLDWFETIKNSEERIMIVPLGVEELPCRCKLNSVSNPSRIQKTPSGWIHLDPKCNKIIFPS